PSKCKGSAQACKFRDPQLHTSGRTSRSQRAIFFRARRFRANTRPKSRDFRPFCLEPPVSARLDAIDWKILKELQGDGRMTNVELARRVGISAPPCLRRV